MNLKTKLAAAMVLAASASLAQATTYNISATFTEPMISMGGTVDDTLFTGSFDWNGTAGSNLQGTMNSSMSNLTSNPNMSLTYNLYSSASAPFTYPTGYQPPAGSYTMAVFLQNSINTYDGGIGNAANPASNVPTGNNVFNAYNFAKDGQNAAWDGNAYFLFTFDAADPTNTASFLKYMTYGDCTALGMMPGNTCMTGKTTSMMTGGTMMAYASDLSITAAPVPLPAAAWLFGGALLSLFGANRRKSVLPA